MIQLKDHDLQILIEAQIIKYGDTAAETAREKRRQLREMGDTIAADLWEAIERSLSKNTMAC